MALSIDGTGNGTIGNLSVTTATGNIVSSGDSGTITAGMLNGGQTGSTPAFAVRAWVNFNGQGTVAIRDSGNVSSITDGGTGTFTINFTTAFADVNYAVTTSSQDRTFHCLINGGQTTSSIQVRTKTPDNSPYDADPVCAMAIA